MDAPDGLRERKKRRTRDTLAREALRLYTAQGFADTTVEQVAAAADVSTRTFFRYFATKEDAVLADHEARLREVREAFSSASGSPEPISAPVRRALLGMMRQVTGERREALARAALVMTEPSVTARSLELQGAYEDEIARGIADMLGVDPDTDARPGVVAGAALGALRAAMRAWVRSGGTADPRALIEDGLELLETGIGQVPLGDDTASLA